MAQSTIRRVKAKLENYIMISDFLGNYIIDGSDMDENTFSELAEKIPNEEGVVKAFELAPEGIITEIYPMQGNSEALELDVLREHERKKDAVLAKETGEYTLGGPYQLKQEEPEHYFLNRFIEPMISERVVSGDLYSR